MPVELEYEAGCPIECMPRIPHSPPGWHPPPCPLFVCLWNASTKPDDRSNARSVSPTTPRGWQPLTKGTKDNGEILGEQRTSEQQRYSSHGGTKARRKQAHHSLTRTAQNGKCRGTACRALIRTPISRRYEAGCPIECMTRIPHSPRGWQPPYHSLSVSPPVWGTRPDDRSNARSVSPTTPRGWQPPHHSLG